jgi:arylsulfatase A-like enzyme
VLQQVRQGLLRRSFGEEGLKRLSTGDATMTTRFALFLAAAAWLAVSGPLCAADDPAPENARPNVLFLAMDDLRPELGAYGQPYMHTPSIDRLAATGVTFVRAFANVPVCGASRASMMTGLRPTPERFLTYHTRVDKDAPGVPTLAGWFRQAGYTTISLGKVLHHSDDAVDSWSETPWDPENDSLPGYRKWRNYLVEENIREDMKKDGRPPAFEAPDVDDDAYFDGKVAVRAIEYLGRFARADEPFFLAVGFVKPHLPFNAPSRYWDLYPESAVQRPVNQPFPESAPRQAWHNWGELRHYAGVPGGDAPVPEDLAVTLVRGYRAATSYADAQVGRVLDELERLGLAENTVVVLWGDHGFSLGEHGLWVKHSPFELANRVPLIVRAPGAAAGGVAQGLVETVDIFPTLAELAGLPLPSHLQGRSFAATVADPAVVTREAVFPRWQKGDSIRTDRYYYTEWRNPEGKVVARMLYDHANDPGELDNVAENPDYALVVAELSQALAGHLASLGSS